MVKGITVDQIQFIQEPDSLDSRKDEQKILIGFHDAGGGHYWRIEKVNRWAMDSDDGIAFVKYLNSICKQNDKAVEE